MLKIIRGSESKEEKLVVRKAGKAFILFLALRRATPSVPSTIAEGSERARPVTVSSSPKKSRRGQLGHPLNNSIANKDINGQSDKLPLVAQLGRAVAV